MDERDFPSRKDIFGGQIIHFPRNISRKLKFRQGFNTDNRFLLTLEYPPRFWNVFLLELNLVIVVGLEMESLNFELKTFWEIPYPCNIFKHTYVTVW